ncbi:FmdE family protein [uncultured Desulfosarcina sp.]|uniref:FmdE family protein n=1 Tax=uncultured Desulfosarcina sp. TaxID=218289 RepID=UPI0029C84357|nr:FmdE family protein [uncultured Desulfosarcina sp.]
MHREEALRAINEDQLDYIQKPVSVDFDTAGGFPLSFTHCGEKHVVGEILAQFRTAKSYPINAFLVRTAGDLVFLIYFQIKGLSRHRSIHQGSWVLSFRILHDYELMAFYRRERKMIVNMALKRIADFHGHVCPDLVLGCKLCEVVQNLLPFNGPTNGIAAIIAENSTSALDAIQILLGATLGNQRLKIMDLGKHNYTVIPKSEATGYRVRMKSQDYDDEDLYQRLSGKMLGNTIVMDEVVKLQILLDERVKYLLRQPPEALFEIEPIQKEAQLAEGPSVYLTCCRCGEQVLASHAIERRNAVYCLSCLQRTNAGCRSYRLH